ncbi:hypothetical protein ZTR_05619 [Talaromyces verruculosus]|nr:hypothetical protein ZTR_05619 [Talaromyces verruculosus]
MVLEPILEEPEDEYVDLFNLSDGEGAPPRPAVWRSLSGPSQFYFQNDAASEQKREHITTIIDRPMVVHGTGISTAYHTEITSLEADERSPHDGRQYQIIRMADGSEFAFPAAPSVHEREDPPPLRAADISLPPALRSPSYLNDSSWIYQPPGQPLDQPVADNRWHVSDPVYEGRSGTENIPIFSTDTYPVNTPVDPQFREYSASDPGTQEYAEWRSASGSRQRSGTWHESRRTSFEASLSAALLDVSSQTRSSYHAPTNDAPTRPQSIDISTGNDETSVAPASTPTGTTIGRNVSAPTHVLDMAVSGKYSDLKIALDSAGGTFLSCTCNVHRVIISESSVLSKILNCVTKPKATIHLIAAKSFSLPRGFEFALQRYYGLELITKDNVYDFARTSLGEVGGYGLPDMLKKAAMDLLVLDNLNNEVVQKWAPKIASATINFLVENLPSDFYFDRTGLSKDLRDRIPSHLREEYSIANRNPMLATLAFGEHPVPTPEANRASAILLALPFVHLREVFEEMRGRGRLTGDLIKAILQEREMRRVSALQTRAQRVGDGQDDLDSMKELGYREFAVHIQTVEYPFGTDTEVIRHEYTLHREWRGYQPEGGSQSVIRKFGD